MSTPDVHPGYASFWRRAGAGILDVLLLLPIGFFAQWIGTTSRTGALAAAVLTAVLFWGYTLCFHALRGQTPGKMIAGIHVVRADGRRIGWRESWMRNLVDLALALVVLAGAFVALGRISGAEYTVLGASRETEWLDEITPRWARVAETLNLVWICGGMLVMLLNERRRAIHDFIGGTIVVERRSAPS